MSTELGIGATDATFADFWQSARTLLHGQQHLRSCQRSSVRAALVAAALFIGACSTLCQGYLLYKLCLGAAVSALLSLRLNLGQLKHFHGVVSLPVPWAGSNPHLGTVHCRSLDPRLFWRKVQRSNSIMVPRHTRSSQTTGRRNVLLVLPPSVTLVLRLTEQNLHGEAFISSPNVVSSQRGIQCSPGLNLFCTFSLDAFLKSS